MILIVDDDAAVRDSLRFLLECEGYETREFASGRELLAAGGAGEGDCLILDVNMPGMSGIELLETMRGRGDMHPVIVISGRTDPWTRKRAHAAGALAILDKPYQVKEVLELLRAASIEISDRRLQLRSG
jgi:two-component system, LuxR family, response regulator FixJ